MIVLFDPDAQTAEIFDLTVNVPEIIDLDAEWGDWLEATYDPDVGPWDTLNEKEN